MGILFDAVFSGIEIIWDRQFGFLKKTLAAPVPRIEIVLGHTLGSPTLALIQGGIVFQPRQAQYRNRRRNQAAANAAVDRRLASSHP